MVQKSELPLEELNRLKWQIVIRLLLFVVILGMLALIPAGTVAYWQFYVYTGILVLPMSAALVYFIRKDPRFLQRRTRMKEQKRQQGLIQLTISLLLLMTIILSGLDRRMGWSEVPLLLTLAADILVLSGYILIFQVFKHNSFASRIVEVAPDQKLITTGLYSLVRHPMYLGVILMYLPTPLALGSYWSLIPVCITPALLIYRIGDEEKLLRKELTGYEAYCRHTPYRLIPRIW